MVNTRNTTLGPRLALGLALVCWLGAMQRGPAAPALSARLDREIISLGESATLTLTVEDATPEGSPILPALPNLSIAAVGQSTELSIVNGQRSSKQHYNFLLTPAQTGEFGVPSIQVRAGGRILASRPLKLKVVQGAPPGAADPSLARVAFLKLLAPKTELFLGEALPVDIVLYVQEGRDAHLPQLQGQGFSTAKMAQGSQTRALVNGQVFNVLPFKTYVAPVRAGQLTLGPATMNLAIPRGNARRSFFGDIVDWRTVTLASESNILTVLPLPQVGVPESFTGAVGTYDMKVAAGPTTLAVGDPITVKIEITGRGLLDALALPPQPQWRDFKAYPPKVEMQSTDPLGLAGVKTFEQVLVPENHEVRVLPSFVFSFFDPEAKAYRVLSHAPVRLEIRPSTAATPPPVITNRAAGQNEPPPPNDILHIKARADRAALAAAPWVYQPWFWVVQGVPVLTWLALWGARQRREALANNPRARRQREVARRVQEGLTELPRLASAQQAGGFFAVVFRLLQEQLGERLDLPASAITEAVIEERLSGRGLSRDTTETLHELFQACNAARYAPVPTSQELNAFVPKLEGVLRDLQQMKG
jgi:hypothetical protein